MIAALGIGGEWAAGAAMVAEVVPEKRRVEAGALLYTSAPMGLFLATFLTFQITGVYFNDPAVSWRYVFLCGLIPAAVAFVVRVFVKEPERWKKVAGRSDGENFRAFFAAIYSPDDQRFLYGDYRADYVVELQRVYSGRRQRFGGA